MRRQHHKSQRPGPSLEAVLQQRDRRPYCPKCRQFVKSKDAVWVGRHQSRCPACGELLERRADGDGQAQG
jgi:hypothetical protein